MRRSTLLKQANPLLSKYWTSVTDEVDGSSQVDMVAGTAWPINHTCSNRTARRSRVDDPSEGVTGWADTWMMSSTRRTRTACWCG